MGKIEITQRNGKKHSVLFSDCDEELIKKYKWHISTPSQKKTKNKLYYAQTYLNGKQIRMHKLIMPVHDKYIIDHIDKNGLNNQRSNLRVCTYSENQRNRRSSGASKYIGVSIHKNKYRACISVNKKQVHLGCFDNEVDAALAYNTALIKYFNIYNLNIISC